MTNAAGMRRAGNLRGIRIRVDPAVVVWERYYPGARPLDPGSYFHVARLDDGFADRTVGEEGQRWEIMPVVDFLAHPDVVSHRKLRLEDYRASHRDSEGENPATRRET